MAENFSYREKEVEGVEPDLKDFNSGKKGKVTIKRQKGKSKQIETKEIKLRPVTDIGDYKIKLKKAIAFLEHGDKVKFTVRFRGREMAYQRLGLDMLKRIEQDLAEYGKVEQHAKLEGRQMAMVVVPVKNVK